MPNSNKLFIVICLCILKLHVVVECTNFLLIFAFLCTLQYYALQILETVIKTRWKILPRNQCEGNV